MNLSDMTAHWVALHEGLGLGAEIRDDAHYAQLLDVAEHLMADTAALDASPLGGWLPWSPTASAPTKTARTLGLTPARQPAGSLF